jgi:hypothetical protein
MKPLSMPLALGCLLVTATWAHPAHACGSSLAAGPGTFEALIILLAVFGIGTSASIALGRGSAKLRAMALRRPSRGLRVSAIAATAGFAATTAFVVGMAMLLTVMVLG